MKKYITHFMALVVVMILTIEMAYAQGLSRHSFKVVNMIPNAQSNETNFDSETNIAVNPASPANIVGSAFTRNPTGATNRAPIFVSSNGGTTWALNNIVPSGNGMTGDISLGFGATSGTLYSGILRGGSSLRIMMLRTPTPGANTLMTTLADRSAIAGDQPYVSATTVADASSTPRDRVFSGDNLFGNRLGSGGNGRTAEVMVSNDAAATPFGGFTNLIVEARNTAQQDMPATRMAIHNSGVVYGVFYSWQNGNSSPFGCDVVVVRDDNFATNANPFTALTDTGDSQAGQRIVTNVAVPAFGVSLGNNRLVASNLAIAVDPNNAATVYVAWCDRVATTDYTLHVRRSTDSGQSWGAADLLTITNATNPGIAIANNGRVGIIYQQLTGAGSSASWVTHFRSTLGASTVFTDDILSTFLDSDLSGSPISPSLGDYLDIEAVGNTFYGVFPASNRPLNGNFPKSVTYQRNANFSTGQLRNLSNTGGVNISVDPFFFRISPRLVLTLCQQYPAICNIRILDPLIFEIPRYPCLRCPWPCLSCPPFEIPFEDLYKRAYLDTQPETILKNPYFHLRLDGYNPTEYDIALTTSDGEPIKQNWTRTQKGYVLSFRPSKKNFNRKEGIQGLKITAMPKTKKAASKPLKLNFKLEASDYQIKQFLANRK